MTRYRGFVTHTPDWEQEREHLQAMAAAGATWWIEFLEPPDLTVETLRAYIQQGPLRID